MVAEESLFVLALIGDTSRLKIGAPEVNDPGRELIYRNFSVIGQYHLIVGRLYWNVLRFPGRGYMDFD